MKKRKISASEEVSSGSPEWLPLEALAEVEISSEAAEHPIEAALVPGFGGGWRASAPGEQTIRLNFEQPQAVAQVRLVVEEHEQSRTQELVLRAASSRGGPWREIVRQQFNFSPGGSTREQEDYRFELPAVAALELRIVPDISGGDARASLQELRIAAR